MESHRNRQLKKATKKSHQITYENEDAARSALIEFCIYVCFLTVALLVATSSRHMSMYFFSKGIENLFLSREVNTFTHEASVRFADLATTADMWAFLETKFIIDLHGVGDTGDGNTGDGNTGDGNTGDNASQPSTSGERTAGTHSAENKLIFLEQNLVLGPPRLRQIRVKEGSCDVHDVFGRYFNKCYADYSSGVEDTSKEFKSAKYKTLNELGAHSIWGEISTYRSGGFVKDLTYDFNENKQMMSNLKTEKWLDRASRLIIVEFTLFNANRNIMNNV
ncbi:PREDICTED: polycystin-2-like, partial [Rhagoletis zephyria]|uniref:polycystin-2-like n=1 Tax=Rhagoletis zephyria TaxID=28612 RepID=UPI0008116F3F